MDADVVVASDDALDGSVTPDAGYTVPEVLPGYGAASCASALQLLERLHSFHGYGGEMLLFRYVRVAHRSPFIFSSAVVEPEDASTAEPSSGDESSSDSIEPEPAPMTHDALAAVVSFVMQTNANAPAQLVDHLESLQGWLQVSANARQRSTNDASLHTEFQRETEKAKRQISDSIASSGDRAGRNATSEYVWAKRYSEAVAESDPQRQLMLLSTLREDFLDACKLYGSVICVEACLPDYRKTIKPVALGGIAGGSKFKYESCCLLVCWCWCWCFRAFVQC